MMISIFKAYTQIDWIFETHFFQDIHFMASRIKFNFVRKFPDSVFVFFSLSLSQLLPQIQQQVQQQVTNRYNNKYQNNTLEWGGRLRIFGPDVFRSWTTRRIRWVVNEWGKFLFLSFFFESERGCFNHDEITSYLQLHPGMLRQDYKNKNPFSLSLCFLPVTRILYIQNLDGWAFFKRI